MFNAILKNVVLIENNKDTILNLWLDYDIVKKTLCQNTLNHTFFRDKFASKVFDFAVSVVKTENQIGSCPVITVMLMLFKKKNIPLSDIFIICVHLKNSFLHFSFQNKILDDEMINEICILMDYNFEGVIRDYTAMYYHDEYREKTCLSKSSMALQNTQEIQLATPRLLSTSAKVYLQEIDLDMGIIAELNELESEALDAIEQNEYITKNSLVESANLFEQYSKVLNMMYEFEDLSYTLTILKDLLKEFKFDSIDDETRYVITIYLKAVISDLQSWRMSIFITGEAEDIHYLDKTLMSSIAQLEITLMPGNNHVNEDEVEFF